jgi:hypothetical protein
LNVLSSSASEKGFRGEKPHDETRVPVAFKNLGKRTAGALIPGGMC